MHVGIVPACHPAWRGRVPLLACRTQGNKIREDIMRWLRVFASSLGVLAALAAAAPSAVAQQPLKIRVGWITTPASLVPVLFLAPGIARHHGKSYTFEPTYYTSSTLQITALSTGELDIAGFGYTSFPLAVQNAGLTDLRIIADEIRDGVPGHYATPYMVRKDSGIARIEDLKGKVLATNGLGSGVDIIMRTTLRKHGLEDKRDFTILEAPFPTHKALLKERKADLVTSSLPFSYDPELLDFATTLFDTRTTFGETALSFWAARKDFIDRNRAALVDLMEDYIAILAWYHDPANHKQAVQIVADFLKRPPALFESWLFTRKDFYRDPKGIPSLQAVQASVDRAKDFGFVREPLDVSKFADLSLIEEAAKRGR
jgi:sulfonate transport system substrate-binding protein